MRQKASCTTYGVNVSRNNIYGVERKVETCWTGTAYPAINRITVRKKILVNKWLFWMSSSYEYVLHELHLMPIFIT